MQQAQPQPNQHHSDAALGLFAAVARRDYDGMVAWYARAAHEAMGGAAEGQWNGEEKRDESFVEAHQGDDDASASRNEALLRDLASLMVTTNHNDKDREPSPFSFATSNNNDMSSTTTTTLPQMERLAWESAACWSNAPPPPSFVVYDPNDMEDYSSGDGAADDGDDEDHGSRMDLSSSSASSSSLWTTRNNDDRLPLFDGSVAIATPPPLGGTRHDVSSHLLLSRPGSGTLLHLACGAMHDPLAFAMVLIFGGYASAKHTAFRRGVIHEAACHGSVECLKVLLELGVRCRQEQNHDKKKKDGPPMFPFLSSLSSQREEQVINQRRPTIPFLLRGYEPQARTVATPCHDDTNAIDDDKSTLSFVEMLQEMRQVAQQVQDGHLSRLDGARVLLSEAQLSEATRIALARSCTFSTENDDTHHSSRHPHAAYLRLQGYADGHGNTPLHWAAFKNEVECVSQLLRYHADPNARAYPSGWSPLHDAAYSNSAASLALLLQAGAHVNVCANSGATPLCFAAQEDAAEAATLLLARGADMTQQCLTQQQQQYRDATGVGHFPQQQQQVQGRFSGYTPLHYCAHYNAYRAAKVLLMHPSAHEAMEVADMNERLPIHVAVARGSSNVLRELLHAGVRVDTTADASSGVTSNTPTASLPIAVPPRPTSPRALLLPLVSPPRSPRTPPVSSPVLRSMIPARPIASSKPWNCLTQRAIDECRNLISEAERNWAPNRHLLFTPTDRRAVLELLRVGKRLEQMGTGIFVDLWPLVLSFCGRGWFDVHSPSASSPQGNTGLGRALAMEASGESNIDDSVPSSRRTIRRLSTDESMESFYLDG